MQINTGGKIFEEALSAIRPELDEIGKKEVRQNAAQLLKKITSAFEDAYDGDPLSDDWKRKDKEPLGLVYGKIQSGKTRAMIATSAMALDNGYKIILVLTSNNNRLTDQTHKDFQKGLPSTTVLGKKDLKKDRLELEKEHLQSLLKRNGGGGIVVVTSKNHKALADIARFVKMINADVLPAIVFDDEGDEASLDTNTRRRSLGEKIPASRIHDLIHGKDIDSVRRTLLFEVFVCVTGTPQAILLQSKDTNYPVGFIELLEPGINYVGGDTFFSDAEPLKCEYVTMVDPSEKFVLLDENREIPDGLKDAICFFILSATAAALKNGSWDEYKLLCHPSVKQTHHKMVHKQIASFIGMLIEHLETKTGKDIGGRLEKQYDNLQLTASGVPSLGNLLKEASEHLIQRKIFIINATTTDDNLAYSPYFNFMIGGNSIGRGLAIRNLLVTYYVREPKVANMDTMYQHARMFGYRRKTLEFTRVFLPYQLFARFRSIHESDEKTRKFIAASTEKTAAPTIEVDVTQLRATRHNVIDALAVVTVMPGSQLYPDRPIYSDPEATLMRRKVMKKISEIFPDYDKAKKGKEGIEISPEDAFMILKSIKTDAANSWSDKMVREQLRSVATNCGNKVRLFYRKAAGRKGTDIGNGHRAMPQAVLHSSEVESSAKVDCPVLWIFEVGENVEKEIWGGVVFVYPTVIFPKSIKPFVFNKK